MEWSGKRVSVVGLGKSNEALARYLVRQGAMVTARDQKSGRELGPAYDRLSALGVDFVLGPAYLHGLERSDAVFLTPGMRKDLPEVVRARHRGTPISTEADLFLRQCRAPVVGVTGSNGKTTTTALIGSILEAAGFKTYVGGNIGNPLIDVVEDIPPSAAVVLELSSFQLELVTRSPRIAVVTNIYPNHLDVHRSMEAYVGAKSRIYAYQSDQDVLVLNADDPYARDMAEESASRIVWFSSRQEAPEGAFLHEGRVVLAKRSPSGPIYTDVCGAEEIPLLGRHNLENALAACAVGQLLGATAGTMRDVVTSFTGVAHRLELVREHEGVRYYNDSIATSPSRAKAGLLAFDRPVTLIAGGYDKRLPFDEFAQTVIDRVAALYLIGETASQIKKAVREAAAGRAAPPIETCASLEEAVKKAKDATPRGGVVLLSPACASYDMFPNFEARGERFRKIVHALTEGDVKEPEKVAHER